MMPRSLVVRTRQKILLARWLSAPIRLARRAVGLGEEVEVRRDGLRWRLDLDEGIDFAIYLLGRFEAGTVRAYQRLVGPGDVALDIGANIGAHSLHLARLVGDTGRVTCFEPTSYAYAKLRRNLALNSTLAGRVTAEQVMLTDPAHPEVEPFLFASWPLRAEESLHARHLGLARSTAGARATTLDRYLEEKGISRVDFVKLDVDGHECAVLGGASGLLRDAGPTILLEISPYQLEEAGSSVGELLELLGSSGYGLSHLSSGRPLPMAVAEMRALVPPGASINAIARVG